MSRHPSASGPAVIAFASSLGLIAASAVTVATAVGIAGCVDTEGAMKGYIERTQPLRDEYKGTESDAAVSADAEGFEGSYLMLCLSPLVAGNTADTLRFKAIVKFTPTGPGTGPLTMKLQPLAIGATTVASPIGPVFPDDPRATAQVTGGKFVLDVGDSPDLPKEANPLTGVGWGINKLVLRGTLTAPPEKFCANLEGFTRPSLLDAERTVCLLERATSDDQVLTVPEAAAFTCPR